MIFKKHELTYFTDKRGRWGNLLFVLSGLQI